MYKFKTEPFQHQKDVLKTSWSKTVWAYFMEMGTGKSKVCIDNVGILFEKNEIDTFIVIAPKGVYRNWSNIEIPVHLPDHIEKVICVWRPSPNKKEKELLLSLLKEKVLGVLRIFIMNVEALSTAKGTSYLAALLKKSNTFLAIDESTAIKNPKAKRTKTIIKMGKGLKYKRILTGSPVTQSPLDLWAQCNFLSPTLLGETGDNFFQYQYRFAIMKKTTVGANSFNMIVGYRNLDKLAELLKNFSSRIMKEECLDLPDKIYLTRNVQLTEDQERIYSEIKEFALANITDEDFMTAPNIMTQLVRLQQVLSGHTKTDDGKIIEIKDNRLPELINCIEDMSGKIIIWSRFRYDIKRIYESLTKIHGSRSTVTYYGDTSDEDRREAIEQFQNGDARFFIGNPQTGGHGITLTAANNVIYFANSFDLALRMQSEDRCHRIGQKKKVTYVDLIAEKTIDEKIVKALVNKKKIASLVMGDELKKWLT